MGVSWLRLCLAGARSVAHSQGKHTADNELAMLCFANVTGVCVCVCVNLFVDVAPAHWIRRTHFIIAGWVSAGRIGSSSSHLQTPRKTFQLETRAPALSEIWFGGGRRQRCGDGDEHIISGLVISSHFSHNLLMEMSRKRWELTSYHLLISLFEVRRLTKK